MADKIRIIGVPMDLGASRRGVDMGPSALRVAGLQSRLKQLGRQVEDSGNIIVPQAEEQPYGEKKARYLEEISQTCKSLAETVRKTLEEEMLPLVLGGDHSIAVGTVAGAASHFNKKGKRIGVIWLDAHGDLNTPESSPSGNVHGMPLASIVGTGPAELTGLSDVKPMAEARNVALVGIRDLDAKERRFAKESGVHVFTMRDIDERGMRDVMADALRFASDDTAGICVSLDMDFIDPTDAPGVGTAVRGGATYREAHLALEMIADSREMISFEVVEINPVIDLHNTTATLGVELILSGLGKKIL
jgi:arginase